MPLQKLASQRQYSLEIMVKKLSNNYKSDRRHQVKHSRSPMNFNQKSSEKSTIKNTEKEQIFKGARKINGIILKGVLR